MEDCLFLDSGNLNTSRLSLVWCRSGFLVKFNSTFKFVPFKNEIISFASSIDGLHIMLGIELIFGFGYNCIENFNAMHSLIGVFSNGFYYFI